MKSAQKDSPQWPERKDQPPMAPRRAADRTHSLQVELLEPHGRFESPDALLAAPDGWHHECNTDRNLVHDGTYGSLAGEEWVGRRSLEFSG